MATTQSRFAPRVAAVSSETAAAGPTIAESVANPDIAVIRVQARRDRAWRLYWTLTAFGPHRRPIILHLDHDAEQEVHASLLDLLREEYPAVDFTVDHDFHLHTGFVFSTPEPNQDGFLPYQDGVWGGGPPVLLPGRACTHRAVEAAPRLAQIGAS